MTSSMKKLLFPVLAMLVLFTIASCKKDGNSGPFFKFKINGEEREASGLLAYGTYFSDYFVVYGVLNQTTSETCYFSLPEGVTAGTYQLNDGDHTGYYVDGESKAYSTLWGAGSGSVTIEEIDATHIKGSFKFDAYDSDTETVKKAITEGTFDVEFR